MEMWEQGSFVLFVFLEWRETPVSESPWEGPGWGVKRELAGGKCGLWDKFLQNLGQIERCGQVCLSGPEEEGDFSFTSPLFQRNSLLCDCLRFRQEGIESRDCGSLCVYEGHTQGTCQLLPLKDKDKCVSLAPKKGGTVQIETTVRSI